MYALRLPSMSYRAIGCVIVGVAMVGCSRQETVACDVDARYSTARSATPVQVPDDLSPPNESDALRLPSPATVASVSPNVGSCLQEPPSFFREGRPFQVDESEDGDSSRRARRAARRAERSEAQGEAANDRPATEAEPPAAPPPAPQGEDRVIEN